MDRLLEMLREALDLARSERDGAGRSELSRHLSIAITDLEGVEDRVKRASAAMTPRPKLADEEHAGETEGLQFPHRVHQS